MNLLYKCTTDSSGSSVTGIYTHIQTVSTNSINFQQTSENVNIIGPSNSVAVGGLFLEQASAKMLHSIMFNFT